MEKEELKTDTQMRIRKAGRNDLGSLINVLVRAYDQDPIVDWLVLKDEKRSQRMATFFEILVNHCGMKYDHAFTTEDLSGIAVWYPPEPRDSWKHSFLEDVILLPKWIQVCGIRGMPSGMAVDKLVKKHHLKSPHYYLSPLGVDPVHQGRGIGSHLLQHGLRMCDEKGVPAYLETGTEENIRFYMKHDFKVIEEFFFPRGPKNWTMIYKPQ